ncbi:MAG: prepilin-type N-terminal cleavage/methylation domain-containing protein [Thermoanaerobacterales bacterium]|nr:prepilin-type N-terminal cleavage/methylation domain-containing protein [Bacillota bacterium]MDI6906743.1 prepilin-type N-terminal cleavage/methylation domain-containing protein [Thermoanaerobacterales bacterium]
MKRSITRLVPAPEGFTLVELAVVLVLMGLMAAVAVPGLHDFHARYALRTAAYQMAADIRGLQGEAAGCRSKGLTSEGTIFLVCFYPEAESYKLQRTGGGSWSRTVTLNPGIDLLGSTFTGGRLVIGLSGVPSAGGTVSLRSTATGDVLYVIVTSLTGRVRVSRTPPESWEVG